MKNPFYTKKIDIYNHKKYIDDKGVTRTGYILALQGVECDIQPINAEKVQAVYGYDLTITKQIFIDIVPELAESSIIKFNNKEYKIEKIIAWDTYWQIGVSEK